MKCAAIVLVLTFVVAVNTDEEPEVHRVTGQFVTRTHSIPGNGKTRIVREGGGGSGEGGEVHRITGQFITRTHRITGAGKTRVHRFTGKPETRVHRITGQFITNKHSFETSGEGGVPDLPNRPEESKPDGPKGPKIPKGKKGRGKNGDTNCRNSGLTELADKLNVGLQDLVNGIANLAGANTPGEGLIKNLFGGAQTGLDNAIGGLDQGVSDFFCGFNRVFNKIGSQLGKGNLLYGVLSGLNVFVTGAGSFFGNLGTNAIGAITSGVSDAIHGRRQKKLKPNGVVHSQHGDFSDTI